VKLFVWTAAAVLPFGMAAPPIEAQDAPAELKHIMATPLDGSRPVSLTAVEIVRGAEYPSVISLKGNVEIKVPMCVRMGASRAFTCYGETVVRADAAEFHEDTGEIRASGNVQVTPLKQR